MADALDKLIYGAASGLQELARQRAVVVRHERDRAAAISRAVDRLWDRVLLHYPLTRREDRLDLSNDAFKRLRAAEMRHRTQLLMAVVSHVTDRDNGTERTLDF